MSKQPTATQQQIIDWAASVAPGIDSRKIKITNRDDVPGWWSMRIPVLTYSLIIWQMGDDELPALKFQRYMSGRCSRWCVFTDPASMDLAINFALREVVGLA